MLRIVLLFLRAIFLSRTRLITENLALRHQLTILVSCAKRPRLRQRDRVFWVWLSRFWKDWRSLLFIVKPQTVVRWHRQGFRLYWRWRSRRRRTGRPPIDGELRALIRRMSQENLTWGAPRIQSELRLLGYSVTESTVPKHMMRCHREPSQSWRAFLRTQAKPQVPP